MKQFLTIFKFELKGYLKNKIFVGMTVFLAVAIAIVMFIPNIAALFKGEDTVEEKPVMIVKAYDSETSVVIREAFQLVFPSYNVKSAKEEDDIEKLVEEGKASCAFSFTDLQSYTYYVNNLSIYDTNTVVANAAVKQIYQTILMEEKGLTAEQALEIMSVEIKSSTVTLGKDQFKNYFYTYIMIMALYMVIMLYGQMVAQSVATEKSSRAMELLITSAKPVNMMFGKVLASCLAGALQVVAIFGTALVFYNINKGSWGDNQIVQSIFAIPVDLFLYMLLFFILGFLIYAFLYGAIGSTASKLEDINTSVLPITFLFIIAFLVVITSMSSGNVDNAAMKICSYIPFTSPMAMFTRIAMSTVYWYEILISVILLIGSVVLVGFLSAKIYKAGVVMYGQKLRFGEILKLVLKKQNK